MMPKTYAKVGGLACLAAAIVLIVLAVPMVDVALFGLHEHVASAESHADEPTPFAGHAAHHCDLSMNPAEVAPENELPGPAIVAVVDPGSRSFDPSDTPFDLLIPPRA